MYCSPASIPNKFSQHSLSLGNQSGTQFLLLQLHAKPSLKVYAEHDVRASIQAQLPKKLRNAQHISQAKYLLHILWQNCARWLACMCLVLCPMHNGCPCMLQQVQGCMVAHACVHMQQPCNCSSELRWGVTVCMPLDTQPVHLFLLQLKETTTATVAAQQWHNMQPATVSMPCSTRSVLLVW